MTDQEKAAAAEQKAREEADAAAAAKAAADAEAEAQKAAAIKAAEDAITAKDAEIAKLKEERDNYRNVALKRLGKLPGDDGFIAGVDEKTGLTVEEAVKKELLDREIAAKQAEKDEENRKLARENAELKLALTNRPSASIGNGSGDGASTEVKDNVFSEAQLQDLRRRAARLNADPEAFIERAKKNLLSRA